MVVTVALQGYGPVTVAAARTGLGALTLCGLLVILRSRLPEIDAQLLLFLVGIAVFSSALPFFLLAWGQQFVPSAFAGLSMAALPLFVLPLAHIFVPGDRLTRRKALGFGLGFLGAAILMGWDVLGGGLDATTTWGRAACLGAAMSYAVASILTRRCPPMDPLPLAAITLALGSLILIPAMLLIEGVPGTSSPRVLLALVALGVVPTALAALLRVQVIRSAGPSFMTLVNYQVPVWSIVFGAVFLSEEIPPRFFVALGLILLGLSISQSRQRR